MKIGQLNIVIQDSFNIYMRPKWSEVIKINNFIKTR